MQGCHQKFGLQLYRSTHILWGIPHDKVDEEFYLSKVACKDAMEAYYTARRVQSLMNLDLRYNKEVFSKRLNDMLSQDDYNLQLYKDKSRVHQLKTLVGQDMLNRSLTPRNDKT